MLEYESTYLIENDELIKLLNKDPELKELIKMFLDKSVDYLDIIEFIEEIIKERNRKINEKKLDSLKKDFENIYEGDLSHSSLLLGKTINNWNFGEGESFQENEKQIRKLLLEKNLDLIFEIFNQDLNNEIFERINLTINYIEGLLKNYQYISIGKTSTIIINQDTNGDLYLKKNPSIISEESYGKKRLIQKDFFEDTNGGIFEYKKVELYGKSSSLNIYQYPDSIYMSLIEFCVKNSYFPVELEKIKKGNIKPLIPDATTSYDKSALRIFETSLKEESYTKRSIDFGTGQNFGYIDIYQDRIEVIDKDETLLMIIEKELVGPLLIGLNHLPGRSISEINRINDIFLEKYEDFIKNQK